jgi:S1-C subfamily serine protease
MVYYAYSAVVYNHTSPLVGGEPFPLWEGISYWPLFLAHFLVTYLGICFVFITLRNFQKARMDVSTIVFPEKTKNKKVNEVAYVGGYAEMSPAKQAGVEEGDVITAVNGVKVKNVSELQDQINRFRPGDKVKLDIVRGATDKSIDVTLKTSTGSTSVVKKEDAVGSAGAAFKELTAEKKKQLGISYGVEVAGVDNAGKFHKEGIAKGFVILKINNQTVSSPTEVERIIQATTNSQDKVLFISGITANGERKYYAVDLGE